MFVIIAKSEISIQQLVTKWVQKLYTKQEKNRDMNSIAKPLYGYNQEDIHIYYLSSSK